MAKVRKKERNTKEKRFSFLFSSTSTFGEAKADYLVGAALN